jgi:hypothetical protein
MQRRALDALRAEHRVGTILIVLLAREGLDDERQEQVRSVGVGERRAGLVLERMA